MELRSSLKWRKNAGQSVVELAMVLPLLAILALGTYDVSRALKAKNVLINLSREGANLALRGRQPPDLQAIMTSLAATAGPRINMEEDGMMYVTKIKFENGVRTVSQERWEKNPDGPCSRIDTNNASGLAGTVPVADGSSVCIFEVVYNYESLLLPAFAPQLHSTAVF